MATRCKGIRLHMKESDHVKDETSDKLCSRCRNPVKEDKVPLRVYNHDATVMWIYCETCRNQVLGVT